MAQTPYAETELLLAVTRGEQDKALRLFDEMTDEERKRFAVMLATTVADPTDGPGQKED